MHPGHRIVILLAENFRKMMQEHLGGFAQLEDLMVRINKTNQETNATDRHTLIEKTAHCDVLIKR